jgi:hypothetical protein
MKVEAPATLRSLGVSILNKLDVHDVAERTKVYDIWNMVRFRLARRGISLLWIDEAHDLFGLNTSTETNNMFKMLKGLMQGDHPVVLVLSGTERLSSLTGLDPQVNRRFTKIRPEPLAFGVDNNRIEGLVKGYAAKASLEAALEGEDINRLIYASRYRFGRCVVNILEAIETALMDGAEVLTVKHFQDAWSKREGCSVDQNVFSAVEWMSIELPDEGEEVERRSVSVRKPNSKRKKAA